jgi:hypothetical protein
MDILELEAELEAATDGKPMSAELRAWCLEQHKFLSEYTRIDDPSKVSDQELAKDVQQASYDYVRCTMDV